MVLLLSLEVECRATEVVVTEAILSDYITKAGSRIGKGAMEQSFIEIGASGFYGQFWNYFNFSESKSIESDLILGTRFLKENCYGKFGADMSAQRWFEEKTVENILELSLKYYGIVNSSMILTKQVPEGITDNKNRFYFELAKPLKLDKLVITPAISTAFLDNFYGSNGWAHVTGKLKVEYLFNEHISVFAQGNTQKALMHNKENVLYGSGGIKYVF